MTHEEEQTLLQELLAKQDAGELRPKDRFAIPAQDMPEQDPTIRRRNVSEVAQGYTEMQARLEACPVKGSLRDG